MDNLVLYIFIVCGLAGIAVQLLILKKRHRKDYCQFLGPILAKKKLQLISSVFPGWFAVGPFPKVEVESGRPQSNLPLLGRGEYSQYRLVTVADSSGRQYTLWALLEFELFELRRVRWRVGQGDTAPEEAEDLLEG
ncbi:hypothetical protein [Desulfogranum mediterraneum]|uniref:hypothetical protein n=1 Tax=Desulfogranum mediterraneum TaxID=160661 RepID=UPI000427BC7B|nr:hypothetical protein [Desulfogranum mediterraneum]